MEIDLKLKQRKRSQWRKWGELIVFHLSFLLSATFHSFTAFLPETFSLSLLSLLHSFCANWDSLSLLSARVYVTVCVFIWVSRTPMTWQSCRSPSSRARPSPSSTAAPEPCTTLILLTTTTTCYTRRPRPRPPPSRWTPSVGQPAPAPCPPQQPPPPPPPPPPPASAGTCPQPGSRPRARPGPPSWRAAPCPSPARTWHATCARSSAMPTSIQTLGPSTPCRSSPPRGGARPPGPSAPSARRGWTGAAAGMEEGRRGERRHSGSGGLASRSSGPCTSARRPATSESGRTQTPTERTLKTGPPETIN